MKIPFFSKKVKKILKDNEERIFLLSETEQKKILKDKSIDIPEKLTQLLTENNELKILLDETQDQMSKELRAGGSYVISVGHGQIELIPNVKVLTDNKIQLSRDRKVTIQEDSWVGKMKSYWKTISFRVWFVESEGEYTFDPRDKTPIEIKKKIEQQLQLGHAIQEKNLGEALINDLGSKVKKWWDSLGFPLIMFGTIFVFLLFIGMFFGDADIIKN